MLKIKIIKGPETGKSFELPPGEHLVGRSAQCQIVLNSPGISKNHAKFSVQGNKCIVTDLGSSNGTFVNGTKIHDRILRVGDRIAFHDIILELRIAQQQQAKAIPAPSPSWDGNAAFQQAPLAHVVGEAPPADLAGHIQSYIDRVVMPGFYKLSEYYPLQHVLAGFVTLFILLVTVLSTIPMTHLIHDRILIEAQRRALTIARQLAATSEKAIANGGEANIRTDLAEGEEGVESALVVSQDDGHIIAPLTKADSYSNEQFVAAARKHSSESFYISELSGGSIGVSVPIRGFSPDVGQAAVLAQSIVIYRAESQNWSATTALFARILIIALLLGSLLYFILLRLISHPITVATEQLDKALRGERDTIEAKVDFEAFKKLVENINSAISRMGKSPEALVASQAIDRTNEASNFVRMISDPAIGFDTNGLIIQINGAFEELTGMRLLTIQGQNLEVLQDQALKLNLQDLLQKALSSPGSIVSGDLAMSGVNYEIEMQASPDSDTSGKVQYSIATLRKKNDT